MYFSNVNHSGPVYRGQFPEVIAVCRSPHAHDGHAGIGSARCTGWTDRGFAVWRLVVSGRDLPGRWVILGNRFIRIDGRGQEPDGRPEGSH
jgi:hypothetical protein